MAHIHVWVGADPFRVSISGRLMVTDMGRLEHACSPALVTDPLRLQLDLTALTAWDAAAHALIERLVARGATVIGPTGAVPVDLHTESGQGRRRSRSSRAREPAAHSQ